MYLNYCRGLRFEEAPDYMYLRQLFRILFRYLLVLHIRPALCSRAGAMTFLNTDLRFRIESAVENN